MEEFKDELLAYFETQNAPLSLEDVAEAFPDMEMEELETILDEMWEEDILCKLESFCSVLYALED